MIRLYDYECPNCRTKQERYVDGNEPIFCASCRAQMRRLPPLVRVNMGAAGAYGYYDDTLETYIHTNRHRREVMRQKGVMEKGATPKLQGDAWV